MENENEMRKLEEIITGLESQIQLKKSENQSLQGQLNELNMNKAESLNELSRLKEKNLSLQSSIENKQRVINEQNSKIEVDNLISELAKGLR